MITRRAILAASALAALTPGVATSIAMSAPTPAPPTHPDLLDQVGITSSSFDAHLAPRNPDARLSVLQLPRVLRDELGMRVLDLNTRTLGSQDARDADNFRDAAEKAGVIITNLKMNLTGPELASPDPRKREEAIAIYKGWIDTAARLGCRWSRALPTRETPDEPGYVAAYQQLCDYAAPRKIQMLLENYTWMMQPDSLPRLAAAIGRNVALQVDTGNWAHNDARYAGLAKAFPLSVSCDFKAKAIKPDGSHPDYDLHRCYQIGKAAHFRGPWCIEHAHKDYATLLKELLTLRDSLHKWQRQ